MNRNDYFIILCLGALALFIWLRDLAWLSSGSDTLPILVAIPLFYWFGRPWHFIKSSSPLSTSKMAVGVFLLILGIIFNLTFLLAFGWTILLWSWLSLRLNPASLPSVKKLLVLPLMAFPWIVLDADRLGWWFRLSGAWVTAQFFALMGLNVFQEGTNILINKLPISVEAACAGLNTLQAMLIAGSLVDFIILGETSKYWWNLILLIAMAWLANVVRIIFICILGLAISPEFAMGSIHLWGGWFILCVMFVFCWIIFSIQQREVAQ